MEDKDKNIVVEKAVDLFALILVALIDEIHTSKNEDAKPSSKEVIKN